MHFSLSDRPKSIVRNRCVIEVFGGVFVLTFCFLDPSVGVGAFVIGLSEISSFLSLHSVSGAIKFLLRINVLPIRHINVLIMLL